MDHRNARKSSSVRRRIEANHERASASRWPASFARHMNIIEATISYEAWVASQTPLLPQDIRLKHQKMREDLFFFLRATYYRWAQIWPKVCPDLANDAAPLAVGDLHVDNFGTWRDSDGRLVWGVNDFDEVHTLPFTHDLVRLSVSAWLAIDSGELSIASNAVCAEILKGYRACLRIGGCPLVLVDASTPLRTMARDRLNNPERFWEKLHSHPAVKPAIPKDALLALKR